MILTRLFRVRYVLVLLAFLFSPMSYASEEAESASSEINKQLSDGGGSKEDLVKRTHLLPGSIEQAALANESIYQQVVWLDSPEENPFLALALPEKTPESHGAVLLLHGVEQHPDWPLAIKPLRTTLTDSGWYTLSIMLPYEHYHPAPKRDLQVKQNESVIPSDASPRFSGRYSRPDTNAKGEGGVKGGDNTGISEEEEHLADGVSDKGEEAEAEPTESADDLARKDAGEELIDISLDEQAATPQVMAFEEKVQMRISAGLEHIAQNSYQNIVLVGYQQGAQGVLDYLSNNKGFLSEKGLTIVWVDAKLKPEQQLAFGELVGKEFSLNMLDVVDSLSSQSMQEGKDRSEQAKRNGYSGYSLVKLPITDNGVSGVSTLTQRVKGWLNVNAPGMQAK